MCQYNFEYQKTLYNFVITKKQKSKDKNKKTKKQRKKQWRKIIVLK